MNRAQGCRRGACGGAEWTRGVGRSAFVCGSAATNGRQQSGRTHAGPKPRTLRCYDRGRSIGARESRAIAGSFGDVESGGDGRSGAGSGVRSGGGVAQIGDSRPGVGPGRGFCTPGSAAGAPAQGHGRSEEHAVHRALHRCRRPEAPTLVGGTKARAEGSRVKEDRSFREEVVSRRSQLGLLELSPHSGTSGPAPG